LAAWFQGLYPQGSQPPVLVGGAAVELYTRGAYTTGDLDFVGRVTPAVARALRASGFERRGRHWVHQAAEVFLELPAERLEPAAKPVRLEVGTSTVLAAAPEALLADRLAAWKFWRSTVDAANALRLLQSVGEGMNRRLAARLARALEVEDERRRLVRLARRLAGRPPTSEEFTRWLSAGR